MGISKNNKSHKKRVNNFKTKIKTKMSQTNQQGPQQMPPVRSIPVWDPNAKIEVTGFEWEAINNGLLQVQIAQQAVQAIMSRNIVEGTITLDFEKLNPKSLQYEPMTDGEKAPYIENMKKTIDAIKNPKSQTDQAYEAAIDHAVDEQVAPGEIITTEGKSAKKAVTKSKVVKGNFAKA